MSSRLLLLIPAVAFGCAKPPPQLEATAPPEVVVGTPVVQKVRDYEDLTGHTEPVNDIEIRPQVTGEIKAVHFKDGADVKENDLLYDIDPRAFAAAVEQAKAGVAQAKARRDRVALDYARVAKLHDTKAISDEEFDRVTGDRNEAVAAVGVAESLEKIAQTNLDYCQIRAKFAGRLSKTSVHPGGIVTANVTMLTTLVALDPIYATFDVDERTILRIRRLIVAGEADSARVKEMPVRIGLADEDADKFPHAGVVTFTDNKVDGGTGTLRVRAVMPNPDKTVPEKERITLTPGLFIRVRIPVGRDRDAILVPEEAVASDQGLKFIYTVNEKDEVARRTVELGQAFGNGLREVKTGIAAADRIVVVGLQRIREGVKVTPKPMPAPKSALPAVATAGK